MRFRSVTVLSVLFSLLMLSVTCGTESGQQSSDDSLPEPWKSLNLDIDGAEVVRASSGELQLVFPFIKPEQMNLPYAMILDGMKKSGWEVIEQDYGKSGKVQAPGGKKYGMEVFAQDRRVVATIWAL